MLSFLRSKIFTTFAGFTNNNRRQSSEWVCKLNNWLRERSSIATARLELGKNLSAVLRNNGQILYEHLDIKEPESDEVLVSISYVGLSSKDLKLIDRESQSLSRPIIIGREASGIIEAIGSDVTDFQIGDRVALEATFGCDDCPSCRRGHYNTCLNGMTMSSPPTDGALSAYRIHKSSYCHKLPFEVNLEEGVLIEPFAQAVHACQVIDIRRGDRVLIIGANISGKSDS